MKTSIHYKDSQGKPRWKSTRLLKQTQQLASLYVGGDWRLIIRMYLAVGFGVVLVLLSCCLVHLLVI